MQEIMRCLHERGPANPGIAVDAEGAMLGPDCVLVRRTPLGYRCIDDEEAAVLQACLFGDRSDSDWLLGRCRRIAKALDNCDVPLAQIFGIYIGIGSLDAERLKRLALAAPMIKASYNPDEPRVPAGNPDGGRWTSGGEGGGTPHSSAGGSSSLLGGAVGAVASDAITAAGSLLGDIGAAATAGLETLAEAFSGPAAFLGFIFIPTNSGLTATGTLPGQPDIDYHLDQDTGHLLLYRNGEVLFDGMPGADGLFHGTDGSTFGRMVNGTMVLDPAVLSSNGASTSTAETSDAHAGAQATSDTSGDQPKLCPAPTADWPGGKSDRAQAYQAQITGLPPGLAVALNGIVFDGCRVSDGTLLEAKGLGYAWALRGSDGWMDKYQGVAGIMDQAKKQSKAAAGRAIEWHFAEQPVADYFRRAFAEEGLSNITVIYTPYAGGGNR
jgi:hypothetical protein